MKDWRDEVKSLMVDRTGPIVPPDGTLADAFDAALAWWRDAGVSHAFADEAQTWLAPPAPGGTKPGAAGPGASAPGNAAPAPATGRDRVDQARPAMGGARESWPADLAAFRDWWLAEPSLDEGAPAMRVPPRGPGGAELMVIIPQPEAEDTNRLLSGPQGRLLDAMLKAMGLDPDGIYRASVLPRRLAFADWADLAASGVSDVLRHHIALAAPRRIIAFGGGISSLLGHDPTQNTASLRIVSLEQTVIDLLPARDLGFLLDRASARAAFWRQWLDWSG